MAAKAQIDIVANDAAAGTLAAADKRFQKLGNTVADAGKKLDTFKAIGSQLGESSALGQSLKLLQRAALGFWNAIAGNGVDMSAQIDAQSKLGKEIRDRLKAAQAVNDTEREQLEIANELRDTLATIEAARRARAGNDPDATVSANAAAAQQTADAQATAARKLSDIKRKQRDEIEKVIEAMEDEERKLRLGEDEAARYALAQKGASDADFERFKALTNKINALKDAEDAEKEAAAESKRAAAEEAARVKDAIQKLRDQGKAVVELTNTPLERYRARLEELNKIRDSGNLSQERYTRAVKLAADELKAAGVAAEGAAGGLESADQQWERIARAASRAGPAVATLGAPGAQGVRVAVAAPADKSADIARAAASQTSVLQSIHSLLAGALRGGITKAIATFGA